MKTYWKVIVRIVGVASIFIAVGGIAYNVVYFTALIGASEVNEHPYFHAAYYTMVAICFLFYVTIIWFGISFIKLKLKYWYIYALLFVVEYLYFSSIGYFWAIENEAISSSIAAATGVANGGLVLQFFSGIFIWGPILIFLAWLSNRNNRANKALNSQPPAAGTPQSGAL